MRLQTLTAHRTPARLLRGALLLAALCGLGGCVSDGANSGGPSAAYAQMGGGTTITFESIDGPPPQVFDRMVNLLDSESKLRNVAVVSREAPAAYRVRSYLAAQIRGGRTMIAWVWDVYDQNQQRALRLSGEEPAGKSGRDAWAQADDLVLRRIAQAGLSGLSGLVNAAPGETQPAPVVPDRSGPAIASSDESPAGTGALGFAAESFATR
ncbi:hypothetical protein HNR60_004808 [Rhodopseudomonas rhenobacensis]|uniref:Uncharacterized protein n=1 Tax=Rhodopseudomonas rhenobacensis TaxID=87461 RepID=A0A7W7Z9L2_9BRAD|nr:hypothetical protein [Rhodopseudomonas rhenobacensis]MBB5050022.1 hypothetical protein [Rhodopseudomonas rhenobacensis]